MQRLQDAQQGTRIILSLASINSHKERHGGRASAQRSSKTLVFGACLAAQTTASQLAATVWARAAISADAFRVQLLQRHTATGVFGDKTSA